ncbi:unnamed protein product, partial [Owenia fusiformis]
SEISIESTDLSSSSDEEITYTTGGTKRKRGRPKGSKATSLNDFGSSSSDEDAIPLSEYPKQKVSKKIMPLFKLVAMPCCTYLCLSAVALSESKTARNDFLQMRLKEQRQFILDYLRQNSLKQFQNKRCAR